MGRSNDLNNSLEHYGVLGMKWGVRRKNPSADTSNMSDDAKNTKAISRKLKSGGVKSLSNKELQELINRQNLEQQYSRLNPSKKKQAAKFAGELLLNVGRQQLAKAANDVVTTQVAKAFKR